MRPCGRVLLFWLLLPSSLLAQYEDLLEVEGKLSKPEERLAQIEYLLDHPLDLNRAGLGELESLPYLSPGLAREIIKERNRRGGFKRVEDLLGVRGMRRGIWLKIRPFLRIGKRVQLPSGGLRLRLETKRPNPRGILQGDYRGDPLMVYTKGRVRYGDRLEVGFLTEKEPGERRLDDLLSSYLCLKGRSSELILGNYQVQFGQGLVLWTGYSPHKGMEVIQGVKRKGRGLIPYTPTNQLYSLNGLGVRLSWRSLLFFGFISARRLDATITEEGYASSIYEGGYHRTQAEEEKRNRLKERLYGLRVEGDLKSFLRLGSTLYLIRYSPRLFNPDYERRRFSLRGRGRRWGGFDLDAQLGAMTIFGELGVSANSSAWILGAQLEEGILEATVAYRHYPPSFINPYSGGFSDSEPINENGFYLGLRLRPLSKTEFRFYLDGFKHPWRGYYQVMPWEGEKYLFLLKRKVSRGLDLCLRETEAKGAMAAKVSDWYGNPRTINQNYRKRGIRCQMDWRPAGLISFRQRWEGLWIDLPGNRRERGNLLRFDFTYHPRVRAKMRCGVCFFQTDSYNSRIWIYERGLPGVIRNLPLWGEGRRFHLGIGFTPFSHLWISLIYTHTLHWGEETTGSGYEERKGNTISEVGFQLDLSL